MSFKAALLSGAFFHLALASAAFAATDCPPLGAMPNYVAAAEAEVRPYDVAEFSLRKADDIESVEVKGRTCRQSYAAKEGAQTASDLEIQSSYREELRKLGAQILHTDERNAVAKLARGPDETWLKVYSQETDIDVVTVVKQALKLTLTPPSGPDYRLLGHMPNYAAGTPEKKAFDELAFAVRGEEEVTEIPAQGANTSSPTASSPAQRRRATPRSRRTTAPRLASSAPGCSIPTRAPRWRGSSRTARRSGSGSTARTARSRSGRSRRSPSRRRRSRRWR